MFSTHKGELPLPLLPKAAQHVHLVPKMSEYSLLSVTELCNAEYEVHFFKDCACIYYNNKIVYKAQQDRESNLWILNIEPQEAVMEHPMPLLSNQNKDPTLQHLCQGAIGIPTQHQLVQYAHAALYSPAISTLQQALDKGYIQNIPGLTNKSLHKYPP